MFQYVNFNVKKSVRYKVFLRKLTFYFSDLHLNTNPIKRSSIVRAGTLRSMVNGDLVSETKRTPRTYFVLVSTV